MNKSDKRFQKQEGIVSLIIPVYNNEGTLTTVFRETSRIRSILYDRWNLKLEVIFIDDKSRDNSKKAINDFVNTYEDTRFLINKKNIGAIRSVYRGITTSKGDCILSMAADLQDPFNVVLDLVEKWRDGANFCAARRRSRNDPIFTRIQAYCFYLVLKKLVFSDFPIEGFDICLVDKSLAKKLINGPQNIAFGINAYWQGYRPEYIYYSRLKRAVGKSSWKVSRRISYAIDILLVCSNILGKIILFSGLISSFICMIIGLYIILYSALKGYPVQGWASIMVSLSIFSSIIIFYLSLVTAYLSRIYSQLVLDKMKDTDD